MAFNDFGLSQEGAPDLARRFNSDHRRGRIIRTIVSDVDHTIRLGEFLISYVSLSAGRTVSLPSASSLRSGQGFALKDESGLAGTHNITLDAAGSDTIEGSGTLSVTSNYGYVEFYTNGVDEWFLRS